MILLRLTLAQFRWFWRLRALRHDLVFQVDRVIFGVRRNAGNELDSSRAIRYIARLTLYDLLIALLATAAIWLPDSQFAATQPDNAAYIQLTSAIASIGGVFIGLYYAAIAAAMTAVYATMPSAVSGLLLRERIGNAYMRLVATLTFTALNLLGLYSLGVDTVRAGTISLTATSGIAIFGFVKLGTRAFRLFNPTAVSETVFRDLAGLFSQVVANGYKWRNAEFQNYARQQCEAHLSALKQLAEACEQTPHLNREPLVNLTVSMLGIASFSIGKKALIPTTSLWFPQSYSQPEWYRSNDDKTSIAHHTGTMLQPKTIADSWFVERELEDAAVKAIRSLLSRRELVAIRPLAYAIESHVEAIARSGWHKEALDLIQRFEAAIAPSLIDADPPTGESLASRVALIDFVGRMRISSILRTLEWANELSRERLDHSVQSVDWLDPVAPYSIGISGYAVEQAEWLAQRLAFEQTVTGNRVTPGWYCAEMLALRDAEALKTSMDTLCKDAPAKIRASVENAIAKQRQWEAACLLSDALHYNRKLDAHLAKFRVAFERISNPKRVGFTWPEIDFQALSTSVELEHDWVIERMATLIPGLPSRPTDLPDYAGQFLHTATAQLFECVLAGDAPALQRIVDGTFIGCLAKHDELRLDIQVNDHLVEGQLALAFAPILDLVELSGYSYLISEAFPLGPTWPVLQQKWETVFATNPAFSEQLIRIVAFTKTGRYIQPRSMHRFNWGREATNRLRTLPTRQVGRGFATREEVDHPSAFVRDIFQPGHLGMMDDGADIFVGMFLLARPGAQQNLAHRQARELARREAERTNDAATADGDDDGE